MPDRFTSTFPVYEAVSIRENLEFRQRLLGAAREGQHSQQAYRDVLGQSDSTHTDKSVEVQGMVVGSHETRGAGEPDQQARRCGFARFAELRGSQSYHTTRVASLQERIPL